MKSFQDRQKLTEYVTTKLALQEILSGGGGCCKIKRNPKEIIHKNRDQIGITMTLNPYLSIVILNVNGLNDPIKRHRVLDWIKKQDPSIC